MAVTPIKIILLLIILAPPRLLAEESIEDFFAMSPAELAMIPVTITNTTSKPIRQAPASSVFSDLITSRGASDPTKVLDTVLDIPSSLQTQGNNDSYSVSSISDGSNVQREITSGPNPELYGSQPGDKDWQFQYQQCLAPTWQALGEAYCHQPASTTYLR